MALSSPSAVTALNSTNPHGMIEQIEFKDITVGNALRILSEQSGLNVVASEDAANMHITMFLRRVTAMEVIDAISKTYNLWYQKDRKSNIVRLYTVQEYRLEKVDFKKEETEVFTMKNAKNALDLAETIQNLYGRQRVRLSFGANEEALIRDLEDRFQLFDLVDGRTTLVGQGGGAGGAGNNNQNNRSGSRSGSRNNRSNNNRSNDNFNNNRFSGRNQANVPLDEYLRSTRDVIDKFGDRPGSGISNLLLGSHDDTRGMMSAAIRHQAPIFVGVIGRQNRVLVRTRDHDAMKEIRKLYDRLDMESSMLMMEVKILSIDLSDGYNSLFDFKIKAGDATISTLEQINTPGDAITNALANAAGAASNAFTPALLATVVSENFQARLELFEEEGRVTELATPILLTSNQEVSRVFVGEQQPIVTGYSASSSNVDQAGGIGTVVSAILVPNTQLEDIGTTLLLTPNINADRTVSIRILVEQSTIGDDQATIPVPLDDNLVDAEIDIVQKRTFSGTVVGKDGNAVAVGGLIEEGMGDREKKVPLLGDIPVLGFFFRETAKIRERKELVVIIKPYIMATPAEAEPRSRKILDRNSVHPDVLDEDDHMMDVYKNDSRNPNGYQLQDDYKMYKSQDMFDNYHGKGDVNKPPEPEYKKTETSPAQETYVELTKYAAQAVRLPENEREVVPNIQPVKVSNRQPVDLLYDSRIKVIPVAGWRKGGVNVTALELHNVSDTEVNVDYRHLRGQWLASTVEGTRLSKQHDFGDATYMYLISAESFDEIYARAAAGQK